MAIAMLPIGVKFGMPPMISSHKVPGIRVSAKPINPLDDPNQGYGSLNR